jgi:hypothetical protein
VSDTAEARRRLHRSGSDHQVLRLTLHKRCPPVCAASLLAIQDEKTSAVADCTLHHNPQCTAAGQLSRMPSIKHTCLLAPHAGNPDTCAGPSPPPPPTPCALTWGSAAAPLPLLVRSRPNMLNRKPPEPPLGSPPPPPPPLPPPPAAPARPPAALPPARWWWLVEGAEAEAQRASKAATSWESWLSSGGSSGPPSCEDGKEEGKGTGKGS